MRRKRLIGFLTVLALAMIGGPPALVAQEPATITGVIKTELGEPLLFAQISVDGMNVAAQSRDGGRYVRTLQRRVLLILAQQSIGQTITRRNLHQAQFGTITVFRDELCIERDYWQGCNIAAKPLKLLS